MEDNQVHMTPRTIFDFQSPGIQDGAKFSSLYDSHEFMAVASQLSRTLSPSRRPSTKTGGSELYDSFELRAVAKQLNMAMQAAQNGTPLYQGSRCLDYLYKRKAKPMKQLAKPNEKISGNAGEEYKGGTVLALWKKLKRAINPQ